MKTYLIYILLLAACIVLSHNGLAQETAIVHYTYDGNGNRIARTLQFRKVEDYSKESPKEENKIENVTEDLAEQFAAANITLFPNPTSGQFQLEIQPVESSANIQAIVTTMAGVILAERQLVVGMNGFDLSQQPAGTYFLRITCGREICVWKIIKQ